MRIVEKWRQETKNQKKATKVRNKDSPGSPTTAAAAMVCAHLSLLHESYLLPRDSQVLGGDDAH